MSEYPKRYDADRKEWVEDKPWVAVVWVNPDLVGRIQRDGTPVRDMWPEAMKRAAEAQPDRQADREAEP